MLDLALIFGGRSAEHEVSLVSASCVLAALDREKYRAIPIGIDHDGAWLMPADLEAALRDGLGAVATERVAIAPDPTRGGVLVGDGGRVLPVDVAFPVLHGPFGEDGTVQGVLELAGIPYAGAGVAASAVGMDKELMKAQFAHAGLPQVDYLVLRDRVADLDAALLEVERVFAYPLFVKPVNLGSSVGIAKAHGPQELREALRVAFLYDRKVIVEEFVSAREIECGVLGNERPEVSVAAEIVPANEFYDYDAKYTEGKTALVIPADLSDGQIGEVRRLAGGAFRAIDCAGYARCDFFVERATGRVLLNEINTIPGMTDVSAFPKVWGASGIDYPSLIDRIVDLALARHTARQQLHTARDA